MGCNIGTQLFWSLCSVSTGLGLRMRAILLKTADSTDTWMQYNPLELDCPVFLVGSKHVHLLLPLSQNSNPKLIFMSVYI